MPDFIRLGRAAKDLGTVERVDESVAGTPQAIRVEGTPCPFHAVGACGRDEYEEFTGLVRRKRSGRKPARPITQNRDVPLSVGTQPTERDTDMFLQRRARVSYVRVNENLAGTFEGANGAIRQRETALESPGAIERRKEVAGLGRQPFLQASNCIVEGPRVIARETATEEPFRENQPRARVVSVAGQHSLRRSHRQVTLVWMKRVRV
jgi:hypothetical protein